MAALRPMCLHIRSYGIQHDVHTHDHDQLVLSLDGSLRIEVDGREDRIVPGRAAVIGRGCRHVQMAEAHNRALIVDLDCAVLPDVNLTRLLDKTFLTLPPAAGKLVDCMDLMLASQPLGETGREQWLALLLETLAGSPSRERSRLTVLLSEIARAPGLPWTVAAMADKLSLSVSRVHALFQDELDCPPQAWLSRQRLKQAIHLLQHTRMPIADIALHCGFADQSTFTRALRRVTGQTPAVSRKSAREAGHNIR